MNRNGSLALSLLLMTALVAGIGVFSYRSLTDQTSGFVEYRRMAHSLSSVQAMGMHLARSAGFLEQYMATRDEAYARQALEDIDTFSRYVAETANLAVMPEIRQQLDFLARIAGDLKTVAASVFTAGRATDEVYRNTLVPAFLTGWDLLAEAASLDSFAEAGPREGLSDAHREYGQASTALALFYQTRDEMDAHAVHERLERFEQGIRAFPTLAATARGKDVQRKLLEVVGSIRASWRKMEQLGAECNQARSTFEAAMRETASNTAALTDRMDSDMHAYGPEILIQADETSAMLLSALVAGSVVGVLLTLFALVAGRRGQMLAAMDPVAASPGRMNPEVLRAAAYPSQGEISPPVGRVALSEQEYAMLGRQFAAMVEHLHQRR